MYTKHLNIRTSRLICCSYIVKLVLLCVCVCLLNERKKLCRWKIKNVLEEEEDVSYKSIYEATKKKIVKLRK